MGGKVSFFLPNRLSCFICGSVIGERIEAARLFYAHPDDVGEVARYGRSWVHRGCWINWDLRSTWAQSAARLLATDEGSVRDEAIVCRSGEVTVLLQDTWLPLEVSIRVDLIEEFREANERGGLVKFGTFEWSFVPLVENIQVRASSEGEVFEEFELSLGRWSSILSLVKHR
jgi:hypothetical protein